MPEAPLIGWKAIATLFGVSERTARRRSKELRRDGAIWYANIGTPPNRRVMAFESVLKTWLALKSKRGEMF